MGPSKLVGSSEENTPTNDESTSTLNVLSQWIIVILGLFLGLVLTVGAGMSAGGTINTALFMLGIAMSIASISIILISIEF
ncbi:hypothetical protein [Natrinema sp. H-ect4]|uniref:hypothetical protein n=1 Tax=Natrinema sp. H-ect4 TaxID=3242699 RepID=UPI0035A84B9E